jgi:hypothetical protein
MDKRINVAHSLAAAVTGVTKSWARQRRAEERNRAAVHYRHVRLVRATRITIREAAFSVMEQAYLKASDGGTLPARPRQIMYAARPEILAITGDLALDDRYFTQTLLPDYMNENPDAADWDVVWDARGHFLEPHTGREVPLGTLEVREYLGLRAQLRDTVSLEEGILYPTHGPEQRYGAVLFVEKEGFGPLFKAAQLAERFDLAIMSTKGMSVSASRMLLDRLCGRGIERFFVLHDFDVSGFSIFGTLGTDSRRYWFDNAIHLIDLGLRLADAEAMGLQAEPEAMPGDWRKRAATLRRHGATEAEIAFLQHRRIELNAMTSRQLLDLIAEKLTANGVTKLIPEDAILERHTRRLIEQLLAGEAITRLKSKIAKQAATRKLPTDLRQRLADVLAQNPQLPWDAALANVLFSAPDR